MSNALWEIRGNVAYDDLRFPANNLSAGVSAPTFAKIIDDGSGSPGLWLPGFSNVQQDDMRFVAQMPHGYKLGTDITPHVHWLQNDADTGSGIRWALEYSWVNTNGTFGPTSTVIGVTATTDGTAAKHRKTFFSAISGASITAISSVLMGTIYRIYNHADDNYGAFAYLIELDFHYQLDCVGSVSPSSK